jgi:hypothetical protein
VTKKQASRFKRAIRALNDLMAEVNKTHPNACWYLDGTGNMNLMSGVSHVGGGRQRQDRIMESVVLCGSSGGDW